jgi:hypothetical protein
MMQACWLDSGFFFFKKLSENEIKCYVSRLMLVAARKKKERERKFKQETARGRRCGGCRDSCIL